MIRHASLALLGLALTSAALAAPKDPVKFAVTLEQMRGHYDASLLNYRNGDLVNQRFLSKVQYNQPLPPGTFDPDAPLLQKK